MKKRFTIGIVAAVLALAIAVPVAASANVPADRGAGSLLAYCKNLVQQLVTDQKLAQSDADAVIAELETKQQALKASRPEMGGKGVASGLGLEATASVLGMTASDLQAKLEAGTTVWELAADAGKLEALKAAIIEAVSTRLDQQVAAGRLTEAEAREKLAEVTERIQAVTADSDASLHGLGLPDLAGKPGKAGPRDSGLKAGRALRDKGLKNGTADIANPSAETPADGDSQS